LGKVTYLLPKFWERVKKFSLNLAGKYRGIGRPHLSGEYSFLTKEHGVRDSRIKKGKKFPAVSFIPIRQRRNHNLPIDKKSFLGEMNIRKGKLCVERISPQELGVSGGLLRVGWMDFGGEVERSTPFLLRHTIPDTKNDPLPRPSAS
jgi:hypothetical protein